MIEFRIMEEVTDIFQPMLVLTEYNLLNLKIAHHIIRFIILLGKTLTALVSNFNIYLKNYLIIMI